MIDGVRMYVVAPPPSSDDDDGTSRPIRPAVILVHQFYGLRQREIELCDELASMGYVAVAPDTFGGKSTGWGLSASCEPRLLTGGSEGAPPPGFQISLKEVLSVKRFSMKVAFPFPRATRVTTTGWVPRAIKLVAGAAFVPGEDRECRTEPPVRARLLPICFLLL